MAPKIGAVTSPITGNHPFTQHFGLTNTAERDLADSMAVIAEKNHINENDFRHIFIHTLRMLKDTGPWVE